VRPAASRRRSGPTPIAVASPQRRRQGAEDRALARHLPQHFSAVATAAAAGRRSRGRGGADLEGGRQARQADLEPRGRHRHGKFRPMTRTTSRGLRRQRKMIAWHHRIVADRSPAIAPRRLAPRRRRTTPSSERLAAAALSIRQARRAHRRARGARIHSLRGVGVGCNAFARELHPRDRQASARPARIPARACRRPAARADAAAHRREMSDWKRRALTRRSASLHGEGRNLCRGVAEVSVDRRPADQVTTSAAIDAASRAAEELPTRPRQHRVGLATCCARRSHQGRRVQQPTSPTTECRGCRTFQTSRSRVSTDHPRPRWRGWPRWWRARWQRHRQLTGVRLRELPFRRRW